MCCRIDWFESSRQDNRLSPRRSHSLCWLHTCSHHQHFLFLQEVFLLTVAIESVSKQSSGSKCPSEKFGKVTSSGFVFGQGTIAAVALLATCWNFSPWYSAYWFPFLVLKTDSLPVGEFPVAELCDTNLKVCIIDNVSMFSSDEQCSGSFSVIVEKTCSSSRFL